MGCVSDRPYTVFVRWSNLSLVEGSMHVAANPDFSHVTKDTLTAPNVLRITSHILQDFLDYTKTLRHRAPVGCGGRRGCWDPTNQGGDRRLVNSNFIQTQRLLSSFLRPTPTASQILVSHINTYVRPTPKAWRVPRGVEPEVSELEGTVSLGIYVKGGKRIQETQQYYNNWGQSSLEQGFRRTSSMQNLVNAPGFQ